LIQEKHSYADTSGQEHHVPIVGFAYPSYDARNACIAAVDVDISAEPTIEDLANRYRDVGAPLLFICCREELQCWDFTTQKANLYKKVSAEKICNFFDQNKEDFSPQRIFLARNLSHVSSKYQLEFVDRGQGFISVLEHEMGRQLARLINNVLAVFDEKLGRIQKGVELKRWLFRCAFWLLGAKILQDKSVKDFIKLDLEDISAVLRKVNQHYGRRDGLVVGDKRQQRALEAASKLIKRFASLKNLTIESLAYVYENTLIDEETRKAWGIHATPPYLVDYIVWQLFDWIRDIPQEERIVFEPTCGHAPFLLSASRLLREIYEGDRASLHKYLKDHLLGIEQDSFAREIARLSLTLADVPNPNGWQLDSVDVYEGEILSRAASKATVLLCNPPFQNFTPEKKASYATKGVTLEFGNKAAEVLARTLPYMPVGSAFGVILPRVFLHNKKLVSLRKYIIENFEIREICLLPENVFASARHISCLILGRKVRENDIVTKRNKVRYVRIPKDNLDEFKSTYNAETEIVNQAVGKKAPVYDFRLSILLSDVWKYWRGLARLGDIAVVGRGLEYKKVANSTSRDKFKGAVQGFVKFSKTLKDKSGNWKKQDIKLTELPDLYWIDLSDKAIKESRYGKSPGCAQILANYARTGSTPWRIKALIDREGLPVTNRFLIIRPRDTEWSLEALWALLNSPYANAFAYCHCMERDNLESTIRDIPLPECNSSDLQNLKRLVQEYFALYQENKEILKSEPSQKEAKKRMLAIDVEIMRLYDLPPKLEKHLLNLFNGYRRKGVDFKLDHYYHKGFESWIPLHEYLSEDYQRSTVSFVSKWVEDVRSPEIIKAFKAAEEAFKED